MSLELQALVSDFNPPGGVDDLTRLWNRLILRWCSVFEADEMRRSWFGGNLNKSVSNALSKSTTPEHAMQLVTPVPCTEYISC